MSQLCLLAEQCERFDTIAKLPATTDGRNLCETCERHCAGDINALVYDYVDLSQLIAKRNTIVESDITRPRPRSTPPIDLRIDTLRSDIALALIVAEVAVRRACQLPARPNRHVRDGFNVQQAVRVVAPRTDLLAGLDTDDPDEPGTALLGRLRALHRTARRVTGVAELRIALPGICPKCQMHALSRRDGSETVTCGGCGFAWAWADYQRHVTLQVTQISPPQWHTSSDPEKDEQLDDLLAAFDASPERGTTTRPPVSSSDSEAFGA